MDERKWARELADRIADKLSFTAKNSGHKIPYTAVDGRFDDWSDRIGWWTNGFWAAQLWLLYHAYGREEYRAVAQRIEEKLDGALGHYMSMDHDAGFRFLLTAVADYRVTGNESARNRGLLAAANMAGRFNLAGNYIRAWNDPGDGSVAGLAIIDCMMNLPMLYWAAKELKDPRFYHIAVAHADMTRKVFVREDGSVHHIVEFDPMTGQVIGPRGGQGLGVGSSWTRGQSWALYGFTLSWLHTGLTRYLDTAKAVAAYFMDRIPESGLIPVDFCQPAEVPWEDSTAAAIAACGLLELGTAVGGPFGERCHSAAVGLLRTLAEKRCRLDTDCDYLLEKCTAAYHDGEHDFPIIYGDYFFTEAVLKLCGRDPMLWWEEKA